MDYIENNLSNGENVIAKIKHSWAGLVQSIVLFLFYLAIGITAFCIKPILGHFISDTNLSSDPSVSLSYILIYFFAGWVILLGFLILLANIVEMKSAQLVVTNKRILGRRGFISKRTTDILILKVDTIKINNGLFGALFNYGTIEIISGASGAMTRAERATLKYAFVSNTLEFKKAVLEVIEKNKEVERNTQAMILSEAMKKG